MKGFVSKIKVAPSDQTEIYNYKDEGASGNILAKRDKDENFLRLLQSEQSGDKVIEQQSFNRNPLTNEVEQLTQKISNENIKKNSYFNKRLHYINTFRRKIKQYSSYFRFTQTNKSFLQIIDDYAFDYNYFFFSNTFQKEFHNVNQIKKQKPTPLQILFRKIERNFVQKVAHLDDRSGAIMLPSSLISRTWDLVQICFLTIYIVYLPIRLAFDSLYDNENYFIFFEVLPNSLIQVSIGMARLYWIGGKFAKIISLKNFCKCFYLKITLSNIKFIIKRYDFVLNICWLVSLNSNVSIWIKIVGVLRIIVLIKLLTEIEQTFSLRERFGNYFALLKLGSLIFMCAHLAGCCWYALAIYEKSIGISYTWLDKDIINFESADNENLKVQGYIAGMYLCIVTMTTIGYGDITPASYRERVFAVLFCILSSFIFAFSMNSIGEIIKQFSLKQEEFKQQMAILNVYMQKRNLSKELQTRVRKYYEYLNIEQQENNEQGSQMIDTLTPILREDVQKDIYTNLFKQIEFFKNNFTDRVLTNLYRIVLEKQQSIDEKIFNEGDKSDHLYIILKGEGKYHISYFYCVQILEKNKIIVQLTLQNRHNLITLGEGQILGQAEFFTQQPYQFSAKTNRFTQFAVINHNDFYKLVMENKHDHENYCSIRDTLLLNTNVKNIGGVHCESCGQKDHIFGNCQTISITKNRKQDLVLMNKRKQITRLPWSRRSISYQALLSRFQIELRANQYIEESDYQKKLLDCKYLIEFQFHIILNITTFFKQIENQQQQNTPINYQNDKSKKGTYIFEKMDDSLKLNTYEVEGSLFGDSDFYDYSNKNEQQFGDLKANNLLIEKQRRNTKKESSQMTENPIKITEEDSSTKSNHENTEVSVIKKQFPIVDNQPKKNNKAPRLSIRQSKIPFEPIDLKYNMDQQHVPLVDLRREVDNEYPRHSLVPKARRTTIIMATEEQQQPTIKELQNLDKNFDNMCGFEYYLTHNNYEKVLEQYQFILNKNLFYQDLIKKSQLKTMKTKYPPKVKARSHKRLPSSQKFYLMKQRGNKSSVAQTPLLLSKNFDNSDD